MDWRGSDGWRTCRVLDAVVGVKQFLVVTDDGRRPWHKQFRVRETEDGRRVAYWWGSFYYGDNARVHLSARVRRVAVRMLRLLSRNSDAISASKRAQLDRLKRMRGALSGKPWYGTIAGGRVHTESCNVLDYNEPRGGTCPQDVEQPPSAVFPTQARAPVSRTSTVTQERDPPK